MPKWSSLYRISTNGVVRSSYFWFVFVPIAARLLEKLPKSLPICWGDRELSLSLSLPFTWQLFFFAAGAIAIANFIYAALCPEIIRKYQSFAEFEAEGKGEHQLIELYATVVMKRQAKEDISKIIPGVYEFYSSFCNPNEAVKKALDEQNLVMALSRLGLKNNEINGAFWSARNFAENMWPIARSICTIFYAIGFMLIAVVIIENIASVLRLSGACPLSTWPCAITAS